MPHQRKTGTDGRHGADEDNQIEYVDDLADGRQARETVWLFREQEGDAPGGEGEVKPCPREACDVLAAWRSRYRHEMYSLLKSVA